MGLGEEQELPKTHPSRRQCSHGSTVTVITGALERVICEECGNVSVRYESMISHDVERSQFSRRADQLHARRATLTES